MRRAASWWQVDRMLDAPGVVLPYQVSRAPDGVATDWTLRLALLARYTGGRRLELLQVRPADLNLAAGELWLRAETTKGQYGGRVIPLHPALLAFARGWMECETLVQAPALELTGRGHADRNVRVEALWPAMLRAITTVPAEGLASEEVPWG